MILLRFNLYWTSLIVIIIFNLLLRIFEFLQNLLCVSINQNLAVQKRKREHVFQYYLQLDSISNLWLQPLPNEDEKFHDTPLTENHNQNEDGYNRYLISVTATMKDGRKQGNRKVINIQNIQQLESMSSYFLAIVTF